MKPKKSRITSRKPTRRAQQSPRTPAAPKDLYARIAKRAYEIYERRIRQGTLGDWLQAEREILGHEKTSNPDMPHRGGYAAPEQE